MPAGKKSKRQNNLHCAMKTILDRLKSATPTFFKYIIAIGLSLGSIGAGLIVIDGISPKLKDLGDNFIIAGLVASAVAKFAKKDPLEAEPLGV